MKPLEVEAMAQGVAPKLDVFMNGSDRVSLGRAEQCASVATESERDPMRPTTQEYFMAPTDHTRSPALAVVPATGREIRLLSSAEVAALAPKLPKTPESPSVNFSLFVQLDRDLDPESRARAVAAVNQQAHRVRWKIDTATIEISAPQVTELLKISGVSYVEPGQTLRGPEPVVGLSRKGPSANLRRISSEASHHRYGSDVLVGIIDVGGFDFAHTDFLDADGATRWVAIWDQGGKNRPAPVTSRPDDRDALNYGSEILKSHMDGAIAAAAARSISATSLEPQSQMVVGSHGTHVASICAGNRGLARKAHIAGVLVTLRREDLDASSSFYDSTRIADAVDYLIDLAAQLGGYSPLPLSINISLGTNGHAHDTSSAMARWIDNALATRGRCVSVAAGNAGQVGPSSPTDKGFIGGRIHAGGTFRATNLRQELGWIVVGDEIADVSENEMEIWYSPQDRINVEIRPPGGSWLEPIKPGRRIRNEVLDNGTVLSIHNETYYPANGLNRISILLSPFFGPVDNEVRLIGPIAAGEWRVRLTGVVVRDGRYDAWIERDDPRRLPGSGKQWQYPSFFAEGSYTPDRMISSLACSERILSVANIDIARNAAHITSSRGPTRDGRCKPDIGADGTNVVAARAFDRSNPWIEMTGTSMASPYVCGVAALMLGVSPRLTAAQIQGIMLTTSAPLAGHDFAWRNDTGFGLIDAAACVQLAVEYEAGQRKAG